MRRPLNTNSCAPGHSRRGRTHAMTLTLYPGDTIQIQRPTKENDQ